MIIFYKDKKRGEKVYIPNSFDKIIYKDYVNNKALYVTREKIIKFIKENGTAFADNNKTTKEEQND